MEKMLRLTALVMSSISAISSMALAQEMPPLEEYGKLPTISQMTVSPSGNRIAYRNTTDEMDALIVQDLTLGKVVGATNLSRVNPRDIYFIDEERIILVVSEARRTAVRRLVSEYSAAILFDVKSGNSHQLLRRAKQVYERQLGLGKIVGQSADGETLYMPAYTGEPTQTALYSLLKIDLSNDNTNTVSRGTEDTWDWFVDAEGQPLLQEQFDDGNNIHRIWVYEDGKRRVLFEEETSRPRLNVVGLTPDRGALLFNSYSEESEFAALYQMELDDGSITGPIFERDDRSIAGAIIDLNRVVYGVRYSGFMPSYRFFDDEVDQRVRNVLEVNGSTAVYLVGWTANFADLLFRISGGWNSGVYMMLKKGSMTLNPIAAQRPTIPSSVVAPTSMYEYEARDGTSIPALLSAQASVFEARNASLIVLPHGGPASHDRYDFDWLAQFLTTRGHMVLQPQFRGSTGFGKTLKKTGRGEWGRKMSSDLDDGIRDLVDKGFVDPEKVCIVGASYGGYAALAAGAFSDFDYKCIVAIAPVSDLREMLRSTRIEGGGKNWVFDYWEEQFGTVEADRGKLDAISPAKQAESFNASVLLIHGRDDSVVPIAQSIMMQEALKKAKKSVEFVQLKGEDHYLSKGETRVQALEAIDSFIKKFL